MQKVKMDRPRLITPQYIILYRKRDNNGHSSIQKKKNLQWSKQIRRAEQHFIDSLFLIKIIRS